MAPYPGNGVLLMRAMPGAASDAPKHTFIIYNVVLMEHVFSRQV
jgi:hypothetical protein